MQSEIVFGWSYLEGRYDIGLYLNNDSGVEVYNNMRISEIQLFLFECYVRMKHEINYENVVVNETKQKRRMVDWYK